MYIHKYIYIYLSLSLSLFVFQRLNYWSSQVEPGWLSEIVHRPLVPVGVTYTSSWGPVAQIPAGSGTRKLSMAMQQETIEDGGTDSNNYGLW